MASSEWTPKKCELDVATRILRDGQGRRRLEFKLFPDVYKDIQKRRSEQNPAKDVVQKYVLDPHAIAEMTQLGIWPPQGTDEAAWKAIDRWVATHRPDLCRAQKRVYFRGIGEGK